MCILYACPQKSNLDKVVVTRRGPDCQTTAVSSRSTAQQWKPSTPRSFVPAASASPARSRLSSSYTESITRRQVNVIEASGSPLYRVNAKIDAAFGRIAVRCQLPKRGKRACCAAVHYRVQDKFQAVESCVRALTVESSAFQKEAILGSGLLLHSRMARRTPFLLWKGSLCATTFNVEDRFWIVK